jgi:hypothetical protein
MNGVHSPPSHCIPKKKKGEKQKKKPKLGTLPDIDVWHKIIHTKVLGQIFIYLFICEKC